LATMYEAANLVPDQPVLPMKS